MYPPVNTRSYIYNQWPSGITVTPSCYKKGGGKVIHIEEKCSPLYIGGPDFAGIEKLKRE